MSRSIKSINLRREAAIYYRNFFFEEARLVQSVNINQTDGSFVTTEPIENDGQIVVYPQSPNNPLYNVNVYKEFAGYGTLSLPMDARFDGIRRKMWVADAGNSRALKISINDYSMEVSIEDIILPHSVVPESNLGGVFIKAFSGINTGIVYYYSSNGELNDYFTYPCASGLTNTNPQITKEFVEALPIPSTMVYDHVRWRLWWTAGSYVYMIDIRNRQVIQHDLSPDYTNTRGLDIDFESGNAFVVAQRANSLWFMTQIFRDNNTVIDEAYLDFGETI
jgi:hypothetical protein